MYAPDGRVSSVGEGGASAGRAAGTGVAGGTPALPAAPPHSCLLRTARAVPAAAYSEGQAGAAMGK